MKKLWSFYPLSYQLMPGEFYVYLTSLYLWQNIWPPKKQSTGGIWWMLYCAFCHEGLINSCSPYPCMSPLIINTPQLEVTCGGRTVTLHTLEPTTAGTSVKLSHAKDNLLILFFIFLHFLFSVHRSVGHTNTPCPCYSLPAMWHASLLLVFFQHAVIETRKGNDQYLLNEVSIPPSLMNALRGCPRAASVSNFVGCFYNFSHQLFLWCLGAAEPESTFWFDHSHTVVIMSKPSLFASRYSSRGAAMKLGSVFGSAEFGWKNSFVAPVLYQCFKFVLSSSSTSSYSLKYSLLTNSSRSIIHTCYDFWNVINIAKPSWLSVKDGSQIPVPSPKNDLYIISSQCITILVSFIKSCIYGGQVWLKKKKKKKGQ